VLAAAAADTAKEAALVVRVAEVLVVTTVVRLEQRILAVEVAVVGHTLLELVVLAVQVW
jgi:hypothetical protein